MPDGCATKHEEYITEGWTTFHTGVLLFKIDTINSKGSLRAACMEEMTAAKANGIEIENLHATLQTKYTMILKNK